MSSQKENDVNLDDPQRILTYWFRDEPLNVSRQRWFQGGDTVDREITEQFSQSMQNAGAGQYQEWGREAEGRLALLLLLDQCPRHIYRRQGAAYRYDDLAQAVCYQGLNDHQDQALPLMQRGFFYLPLEHSENLEDQQECLFLFTQLLMQAKSQKHRELAFFEGMWHYAKQHLQIIEEFGRFPYRNRVLGRLSTEAERKWLNENSSHFGQ